MSSLETLATVTTVETMNPILIQKEFYSSSTNELFKLNLKVEDYTMQEKDCETERIKDVPTEGGLLNKPNENHIRPVYIREMMNGYLVHIGCKDLVFTDREFMLKELGRYMAYPLEVELEYLTRYQKI